MMAAYRNVIGYNLSHLFILFHPVRLRTLTQKTFKWKCLVNTSIIALNSFFYLWPLAVQQQTAAHNKQAHKHNKYSVALSESKKKQQK